MKKMIAALVALFTVTVSAQAMSYEQARQQALFLTDKMAYELNLTEDQYEAAYEINLDYLMSVNDVSDLYGAYWQQRNLDLSYIMLDWQYRMYLDATYFYRPLYWSGGYWHFGIYARYPYRDYFFFGRPDFYAVYRGGHSWHMNGGRSWYNGRHFGPRPGGPERPGMRDDFDNGRFGRGFTGLNNRQATSRGNNNSNGGRVFGNGTRNGNTSRSGSFGNGNQNTRTFGNTNQGTRTFGNGGQTDNTRSNNRTFGNRESSTRTTVTSPSTSGSRTFGNSRGSIGRGSVTTPSRSFTPSKMPNSSVSTPSRSNSSTSFGSGSFGGSRGSSSVGSSRSSSSFGGSRGGGFGGGSRSGGSSGGSSRGGGSFGGHR